MRDGSPHGGISYPSFLDLVGKLDEELLVLFGILAANKNLDRETTILYLLKVFRC